MNRATYLVLGVVGPFAACSTNSGVVQVDGKSLEDTTLQADLSSPDIVGPDNVVEQDLWRAPDEFDFSAPDVPDALQPGCLPGEGCFLDKCDSNEECLSGWCVEHLGEGVCSQACQDECPPGWGCQQVAGTVPDVVYICVSTHANLCRPCTTGADCKSIGGADDVCVDYADSGSFCGGTCTADEDCPWGFSCLSTVTVDGIDTLQCVADAGECPCTGKSVALSLWTPCEKESEFGLCLGKRVCTEEGLTPCDAAIPEMESCNGIDDDCDGDVDEETCDDGDDCTDDACLGDEGCQHLPMSEGECKDGDVCTVGDHCEEGICLGSLISCDDSNPCTDDSCDGLGGCQYLHNEADCDDGDPCTVADECGAGECAGVGVNCACQNDGDCEAFEDGDLCTGTLVCDTDSLPYQCRVDQETVVTCPQPPPGIDGICLTAACDPATGACSLVPDHEGFACDDGDACTIGDHCEAGSCVAGVAAVCKDDNPCTDDSCEPDGGCTFSPNSDPCSDDNVCTLGDACLDGVCGAGDELLACDDQNVCTDDSCDPAIGCVQAANAVACDDNNACSVDDQCSNSKCVGGPALECNDNDVCNGFEGCDSVAGCIAGQPLVCNDLNPCTVDSCAPDLGCQYDPSDGQCDDDNECTVGESCQEGDCVPAGLTNCDDDNVCTTDSCNPDSGCLHLLNQAPCNDGDVCTTGDHCHLGECIGGGELACNDGNPCTDDACDSNEGCTFTPNADDCDDSNACTNGDVCKLGWCLPGPAITCNDNKLCTDDSCDPESGCVYPNNTLPCDDDNACTDGDKCGGGVCVAGPALDCDDNNPCTTDSCDSESGCTHVFNDLPCNDANACTTNEFCNLGVCGGGVAVVCNDENICTDDSCDSQVGCLYGANAAPCDDGNPCTLEDTCANAACQPGAGELDCDDQNTCTDDSCDPDSGCVHTPVANDTPCPGDGTCQAGVCIPDLQTSCADALAADPGAASGVYAIDPDGEGGDGEFNAWCEMDQDDGGWTLVMNLNTSDGHMAYLPDAIWTTQSESGNFSNRWSNDYKSKAAITLQGTQLLLIVRDHNVGEGGALKGWRSWNLNQKKSYQSFYDVSMGSESANATGGCNGGYSGEGRQQTSGVLSSGQAAQWDSFTNQADQLYSNSYYGGCGSNQDGFRLSAHYRWANNSNCGMGLQMDGTGTPYNLEIGAIFKKDTYPDPQRQCCSCGGCQAYPDGSAGKKAAIGSDHQNCHCSVGVSYRYEWYIR